MIQILLECHIDCKTCSGPNENDCGSCANSLMFLDTQDNICKCPKNMYKYTGQCECIYIYIY